MGGFFGVASKQDCVFDLFFGTDYHSHLGTRRGGMVVHGVNGFERAIHNIESAPFRTKFEQDFHEMKGNLGLGCISDTEPQPLIVRSHLGNFAITTVGRIIYNGPIPQDLGFVDRSDPDAVHEAGLLNLDIRKARRILGWKPRWNFEKTVEETVKWYESVSNGVKPIGITQRQIREYDGHLSG